MNDWVDGSLGQNTIDVRNEERRWRAGQPDNVRHLFKADGMPTLTHPQRVLLRDLSRFEKAIDTALQETRAAVHGDDPALAICAARRLQALGAHFGMLARETETT